MSGVLGLAGNLGIQGSDGVKGALGAPRECMQPFGVSGVYWGAS